jgi:hypothetical protein
MGCTGSVEDVPQGAGASDDAKPGKPGTLVAASGGASTLSAAAKRPADVPFFGLAVPYHEIDQLESIGVGSYGEVFKARYKGSPMAMKELTLDAKTRSEKEEAIEDFLKEIELLSKLTHPMIVTFFGACVRAECPALVSCAHAQVLYKTRPTFASLPSSSLARSAAY